MLVASNAVNKASLYNVTFVQCWTNVEDFGPTLYKCYTNGFCVNWVGMTRCILYPANSKGSIWSLETSADTALRPCTAVSPRPSRHNLCHQSVATVYCAVMTDFMSSTSLLLTNQTNNRMSCNAELLKNRHVTRI